MRDESVIDEVFSGLCDHLVEYSPANATRLGDHRRDGDLDDWGPGAVDERLRGLSALRRRLDELDPSTLGPDRDGDRRLMADTLDRMRFELEGLRLPQTDPTFYLDVATGGVDDLLRRDDLPAGPRHAAARARAAAVPRLLDQARANLTDVSGPHREVTLRRCSGAAALFRDTLPARVPEAVDAGQSAATACEAFAAWLGEGADEASVPDWRLGEARWREAARLTVGAPVEAEDVWAHGQRALARLREEAEELAARVLGRDAGQLSQDDDLVRAAFARISEDRSERTRLVADAAGVLEEVTSFLAETGLFDVPDTDRLRVEAMPGFQQGVAVAYLMPAPPFEPEAPHRYYLSPVPDDWDDERAASFLREYNRHALRSVGIHEAYPGHYAHFAAAQRHPRPLRRALWNAACAEGWAVYAERQVVDAGFGGDAQRLATTKMDMRAVANALLDQGVHVHGWDDETAMTTLTEQAYQEHAEASGKLLRSKVTAGQLSSYFVGGEEMARLRADVAAARGASFSALAFHREVVGHGVPPVGVLRDLLLG